MTAGLIHPSGGLVYHWRAWRHTSTCWQPYLNTVREWLDEWHPENDHLVLVGPSAGYSLSQGFLARFERISVLEPDPLARRLLKRHFPTIPFRFQPAMASLRNLPLAYPDAAILFCNLLGQDWGPAAETNWHHALVSAMAGRSWASYHDLISSTTVPDEFGPVTLPGALSLEDITSRFWHRAELTATDHGTYGILPNLPRQLAVWRLTPSQYHLVEWLNM